MSDGLLAALVATQLGCSFFQALGNELGSNDYGTQAVDEFFRQLPEKAGRTQSYAARSVLIDMEPKVSEQTSLAVQACMSHLLSPMTC